MAYWDDEDYDEDDGWDEFDDDDDEDDEDWEDDGEGDGWGQDTKDGYGKESKGHGQEDDSDDDGDGNGSDEENDQGGNNNSGKSKKSEKKDENSDENEKGKGKSGKTQDVEKGSKTSAIIRKNAKKLGYSNYGVTKGCPDCKETSLYLEKFGKFFMRSTTNAIIGYPSADSIQRWVCLNPRCKSYHQTTGITFSGEAPNYKKHKNIFHVIK